MIPRATYRIQFHKDFTFEHAIEILPYLTHLGISHIYASPIMQARPGSIHGYDIVDHTRINAELGGEEAFLRLCAEMKKHQLGLVLDIVPNHMAVGGADNADWLAMLEWGELSHSACMFDVDWQRIGADGKVVVPFLADRYGRCLERGELKLAFDPAAGEFCVWHWEHKFPICPFDYPDLLDRSLVALGMEHTESAELLAITEALRGMSAGDERQRENSIAECDLLKQRLADACREPQVVDAIEKAVTLVSGNPSTPESFGTLHRLLERQHYRLAHWRVASSEINYRRFFDINSLGGLRAEDPGVFARTHDLVFRLVRDGHVHGLRVDHIDGLADPASYVHALQAEIGPDFYILVEKILEPGEELRAWPIAGTTGYDALNLMDGIFVDHTHGQLFTEIYRDFSNLDAGYGTSLRAAKEEIIETSFASELEVIVSNLKRIADADWNTRDYTLIALRRALTEIIVRCPVYRSYVTPDELDGKDRALIRKSVHAAKRWSLLPDRSVHDFIELCLLGEIDTSAPSGPQETDIATFRRRFQQLTGPVMAKSLEDTLFYRYVRLLSLNEVGGDPDHFGMALPAFHAENEVRAQKWPGALIATSTHDTKRGEDARSRLAALSHHPDNWQNVLARWSQTVAPLLTDVDGETAPDANDQYMIFQSILGAFPPEMLNGDREGALDSFRERIMQWSDKALREAKRYTSWTNANEEYEKAARHLIDGLLQPEASFLKEIAPFASMLAKEGRAISLSRTVLKLTLPGVPDFYQGTECFDFSLVDPDNRRPVPYDALRDQIDAPSGSAKQRLIKTLLVDRKAHADLYAHGSYEPLDRTDGAISFMRVHKGERLLVEVGRLGETVSDAPRAPSGEWQQIVGHHDFTDDPMQPPFAVFRSTTGNAS